MLLVSEPSLGEEEQSALAEVIKSGWITMGSRVGEFEQEFAKVQGVGDAVAVSSCTAALHLILEALGIGAGDEVLVPSLTFVASANAVLYAGAIPVFVDIESVDWPIMSRADAATKCTSRTKAVILVHFAGTVADAAEWREFASKRGLLLIEDAAHAAGAAGAGRMGDAAAFSFYGNKNMTTAEGGAVTAQDPAVLARVRQMRGHGLTTSTFQRFASQSVGYDVTMLGYNYRMDELRAAVGLVQLKHLVDWNRKRQELTKAYIASLGRLCPQVTLAFASPAPYRSVTSSFHIMPVVLPEHTDRTWVISALREAGIQTSNHYPPVHRLSYYSAKFPQVRLPKTERFAAREITLPLHPKMETQHVSQVSEALGRFVRIADQVSKSDVIAL